MRPATAMRRPFWSTSTTDCRVELAGTKIGRLSLGIGRGEVDHGGALHARADEGDVPFVALRRIRDRAGRFWGTWVQQQARKHAARIAMIPETPANCSTVRRKANGKFDELMPALPNAMARAPWRFTLSDAPIMATICRASALIVMPCAGSRRQARQRLSAGLAAESGVRRAGSVSTVSIALSIAWKPARRRAASAFRRATATACRRTGSSKTGLALSWFWMSGAEPCCAWAQQCVVARHHRAGEAEAAGQFAGEIEMMSP